MIDKYEAAIKETFNYLEECLVEQSKKPIFEQLFSLGIDKCYIIELQMKLRGFDVYCTYNHDRSIICVYPMQYNLPIHIWRE